MVDYTREMRRGRTLQDRERELQPINKQLDDERVMIKDYTHDQVVAARAAGERPFDLERERKVSAVMKQEREKVIELFEEEEPQEVLDESLQVELDIQDQIDEEEEEAKERLRAFELIAEMRAQEAAEILAKEREGHPMKDSGAVVNKQIAKSTKAVEEFRKEIEKDLPNVDLDKVVLQKNGKVPDKFAMLEKPRKKTLQERLREIEQDQEKQVAELDELQRDSDEFSL
jgi:hypothetical protein